MRVQAPGCLAGWLAAPAGRAGCQRLDRRLLGLLLPAGPVSENTEGSSPAGKPQREIPLLLIKYSSDVQSLGRIPGAQ